MTPERLSILGLSSLAWLVLAVVAGLACALAIARLVRVPRRLGMLIAIGTAICGNTAILTAAPLLRARKDEVAYAVATITIFGTAAVLVFPAAGNALSLSNEAFGYWAGLGVNDTSQVIATGFAYSDDAGETASLLKVIRNLTLAPMVLLLALRTSSTMRSRPRFGQSLPWFVWGFLVTTCLACAGVVPTEFTSDSREYTELLLALAMGGIGVSTPFRSIRNVGARPLLAGLLAMACLSSIVLLALLLGATS
jgi:uncharacterized integral membrane protein (TIGR00698 family)